MNYRHCNLPTGTAVPHYGVFVSYPRLLLTAYEAKERARLVSTAGSRADAAIAIIMAAASAEAFLNELAEFSLVAQRPELSQQTDFVGKLSQYAARHQEITTNRLRDQVKEKTSACLLILRGHTPDWGAPPFQDLALLVKVRDDILHMKPADHFHVQPNGNVSIKPPERIRELQRRKLARQHDTSSPSGWFDQLMTPELAAWAAHTTRATITQVLETFPRESSEPDLITSFHSAFTAFPFVLKANGIEDT